MIFSIYQLRDDPDMCIFDRELDNPRIGESNEYDCAGVFEVEVSADIVVSVSPWIPEDPGPTVVLGKTGRMASNCLSHPARRLHG